MTGWGGTCRSSALPLVGITHPDRREAHPVRQHPRQGRPATDRAAARDAPAPWARAPAGAGRPAGRPLTPSPPRRSRGTAPMRPDAPPRGRPRRASGATMLLAPSQIDPRCGARCCAGSPGRYSAASRANIGSARYRLRPRLSGTAAVPAPGACSTNALATAVNARLWRSKPARAAASHPAEPRRRAYTSRQSDPRR